jgi:hypothetical protein
MILNSEKMLKKIKKKQQQQKKQKHPTEFGKDADLRIPLNWTVIRDNDISRCRFEEWTSIRDWTSI